MDVRSTPEALRHRARLLVGTVVLIVALSLVLGLAALAEGTPAVAAARLVFAALAVPLALAGWRDPSADWPHHLLLCTGAVDFLLVAHLTPGMDVVSLYWAALIPLLATMTFDLRRGGAYAVATALGTALVLVAGADPSAPHLLSAPPATRDTVRIVSFTLVVGACVYLFDLDRRRALAASRRALAEAHAERATKARFFSAMSHELRTPLNGVLGLIQVLLTDAQDAEERRVLALAERSCEALGALIGDVVDESAHRSTGAPRAQRREERPTSLRALAEDVAALSRPSAERKGLALLLEVSPTVPAWVRADEVRVRQLLHNLIGNALKFTDHGHVRVALDLTAPASEGAAPQLRVTVEDTGIGVPSEALATIFEPFRQADASTSRRFGGSGLGLAISRRTAEQLGGTLTVSSSPGVGTRFELALPVVEVEPPVAEGAGAPAPALARRVLCVDDNAVNLRVLELMLTRAGAEVVTARSGHEAARLAVASDFDAVLMDRHMPDGDGLEATRAIRAHGGPRGRVPIIAVTAAALPAELEACLEAGMDEALTKPVNRAALLAALVHDHRPRRLARPRLAPAQPARPRHTRAR
jgi:signal transduction histidine kinase/CheY-like chemotaxis protein